MGETACGSSDSLLTLAAKYMNDAQHPACRRNFYFEYPARQFSRQTKSAGSVRLFKGERGGIGLVRWLVRLRGQTHDKLTPVTGARAGHVHGAAV